jgi:hypothetical protein
VREKLTKKCLPRFSRIAIALWREITENVVEFLAARAVLDHVLGERGVIETWPSSRRRWVRHQSFRPAPYGNSSLGREPQRVSAVDAADAEVFDLRQLLARFRGR